MITLKTLHLATAQQVFDQIVTHLRQQGEKSRVAKEPARLDVLPVMSSCCRYRTEDGLKCAAGCLIADDEYRPSMEGKGWRHVGFPKTHQDLIQAMQIIHDTHNVEDWERKFKFVATEYGLAYTEVIISQ